MILYVIGMSTGKNVPIIIDTINILVSTNIPDQKDISLTSKVLVGTSPNSAKYNEYPYITNSVQLKGGFMRNKSYNEILDFFFIKDVFAKYVNVLDSSETELEPQKPYMSKDERKKDPVKKKQYDNAKDVWKQDMIKFKARKDKRDIEILDYNIRKMLQLLFVTYPIAGNIKNTTGNSYITDIYNANKYSYLNINSKNYTISKAIWIDDKYNHYLSKQLVKDYKEFNAWRVGEIRNIDTGIVDNKKQLIGIKDAIEKNETTKDIFKSDISKIEKYFMNVSNWTNRNQSLSAITIREAMGILYSHLIILQSEWSDKGSIEAYKNQLNNELRKYVIPDTNPVQYTCEKKEYDDIESRVDTIKNILDSKDGDDYNLEKSREFMSELSRTAKIIIGSNLVPISNIVQSTIKDLNENNEKRISLENNRNYIKEERIILGNDKYKNDNFKTLSDAFAKDVQMVKKNINFMAGREEFGFKEIKGLIDEIQNSVKITEKDAFGIIYDNNNVTKPKYEIYMYMDLTDGKVTDDNRDNLDLCTFRDELLLIKFTQLMNKNTNLIQHDPLIKMLTDEKPKQNVVTDKPKPLQGGGTTRKAHYISKNNRTKKINI
ncbi:MAG: hypothetical protein ACOVRN_03100 [Flavobacterium sp.]